MSAARVSAQAGGLQHTAAPPAACSCQLQGSCMNPPAFACMLLVPCCAAPAAPLRTSSALSSFFQASSGVLREWGSASRACQGVC